MTPPFLDREPRFPYDPSFLGKDSLEKRWTACLHNQVFQECWKGSHTNIDMGLLGKDSLEKEEDGMFTQPSVSIISGKDLIQTLIWDFLGKILWKKRRTVCLQIPMVCSLRSPWVPRTLEGIQYKNILCDFLGKIL